MAFVSAGSFVRAEEPGQPPLQELFQTDVVYLQERGELQVTTGISMERRNGRRMSHHPVGLEYGITDRWQIQTE